MPQEKGLKKPGTDSRVSLRPCNNQYSFEDLTSPFRVMFILNRFTETGRFTMFNLSLTCRDGEITESGTVEWEDLPRVLRECFSLDCLPNRKPEPPRMP